MVVRIRLRLGTGVTRPKQRRLAAKLSRWMNPLALTAAVLACWRLGSGLNATADFALSSGILSHWQVWLAMAVVLQLAASKLNRYGRGDGAAMP
jgi:hypothetical protein